MRFFTTVKNENSPLRVYTLTRSGVVEVFLNFFLNEKHRFSIHAYGSRQFTIARHSIHESAAFINIIMHMHARAL